MTRSIEIFVTLFSCKRNCQGRIIILKVRITMNETNKKLQSLVARIIKTYANSDGISITFEVAGGYDDGSAAAGLDVMVNFAEKSVTAKTNDFGVALLTFEGSDSFMNAVRTYEQGIHEIKWSIPPKFLVRIQGYSAIVEITLPLKSMVEGKPYRW